MYLITHPCVLRALLMFRNSLKMIETDLACRSYDKLCVKYNFNLSTVVGFII